MNHQRPPPKKHIFILSGQSNMAGRGGVKNNQWDRVVPDECKPDPSTIHRLNANLIWETAHEPLHTDIDIGKICGVGPGMPFANAIKDYISGVIDLVPCAVAIASGNGEYMEVVRRAHKAIDLPNVVCVDAKGLELKDDNLHLTTEAQVQLGHMLADAYLAHFSYETPLSVVA
ncbi:hypothetical protein SSX86_012037 [Deinandra increscens subsp. villosa]|uniref:Sialate O-acetylesterase domain-containing protein n=1 Tax=Deinandra increscens subsp. villosa TaxID=3103831 RepID=A0AAP0D543_9ASTR